MCICGKQVSFSLVPTIYCVADGKTDIYRMTFFQFYNHKQIGRAFILSTFQWDKNQETYFLLLKDIWLVC